jgi:hypothetical protein
VITKSERNFVIWNRSLIHKGYADESATVKSGATASMYRRVRPSAIYESEYNSYANVIRRLRGRYDDIDPMR